MPFNNVYRKSLIVNRVKEEKNPDERYAINYKHAFTLIELLVVISIIAILVAAASASWTNAQQKSRDGKRKSDLKSIQQALELYFQRNGQYPQTGISNVIKCNVDSDTDSIAWGGDFTCGTGQSATTYINPVPKDPKNVPSQYFIYHFESYDKNGDLRPDSYKLSALLENKKDQDYCDLGAQCITAGKLPCQPAASYNYCVINP